MYDRFHAHQEDSAQKEENEERYHALVKMLATMERRQLLQVAEEKNLLNSDEDFDNFIDGLEMALTISAEIMKYPDVKQILEEKTK